jgi:PEP-CTERM motif
MLQIGETDLNRVMRFVRCVTVTAVLLAAAATARADSFDVSLNTTSLSGPQILAFGFTDGDGVADNNVTLSGFGFGGGNAVGSPDYEGTTGVSGDLGSTINMNDPVFTALFTQQFDPGSSISFLLNITNNFAGVTPDAFAMYVCDTSLNCYSDDTNTQAMLVLDLTGTPLSPSSFTLNGASAQGLPAPVVTVASGTSTVPEPSSLLLLLGGVVALIAGSTLRNRIQSAC